LIGQSVAHHVEWLVVLDIEETLSLYGTCQVSRKRKMSHTYYNDQSLQIARKK